MDDSFKKKLGIVVSIIVIFVFIDQWTKQLAVQYLAGSPSIDYLSGIFQLVYAENPGAFLGMGGGWSRPLRFVVFGLIVVIGLIFMFWSILKNKISKAELIAYSFVLAGGIGNVIDRLTHDNGHVIDFLFIDLKFAPLARTGVFNVADMLIVAGVLIALGPTAKQAFKKS